MYVSNRLADEYNRQNGQIDRQVYGSKDRFVDIWIDRKIDRYIDRQIDRQIDTKIDTQMTKCVVFLRDRQLGKQNVQLTDRWMNRQINRKHRQIRHKR